MRGTPSPDSPSMAVLAPIVDRVRELAAEHLDDPITVDVTLYDDSDCRVTAFHTHQTRNANIDETTEIRYDPQTGEIRRRHYRYHKLDDHYLTDESAVLETTDALDVLVD